MLPLLIPTSSSLKPVAPNFLLTLPHTFPHSSSHIFSFTPLTPQAVWRVEDVAVGAVRLGVRIARKAARPVLVGVVLHRALRAIEESHSLEV